MAGLEIKYIIGIGIIVVVAVVFFFQIRRIWRIRFIMKNFLQELKILNKNVDNIIHYINGKTEKSSRSSPAICKNCMFRLTYIAHGSSGLFSYRCKLDKRKISLSDTCKRFQIDLQDKQI